METDKYQQLINGVKCAVAKYGVSGASTRRIAEEAGVNDANIYYHFKDRDSLLSQAYENESGQFIRCILDRIRSIRRDVGSLSSELKCKLILRTAWRYLLEHPEMCRFCSYYYHSPMFQIHNGEYHNTELKMLLREVEELFPDRETAERCLYAVFTQLYEFAMLTLDKKLPDTEETEDRLFGVLYSVVLNSLSPAEEDGMNSR